MNKDVAFFVLLLFMKGLQNRSSESAWTAGDVEFFFRALGHTTAAGRVSTDGVDGKTLARLNIDVDLGLPWYAAEQVRLELLRLSVHTTLLTQTGTRASETDPDWPDMGVCVAWRGVAWRGVAWRGVAWRASRRWEGGHRAQHLQPASCGTMTAIRIMTMSITMIITEMSL